MERGKEPSSSSPWECFKHWAVSTGDPCEDVHRNTTLWEGLTSIMLHTEKNVPRENIQSMDRATPMEILVKDNGKEVDTLETIAVRCGNGWYIEF